MPKKEDNDRLKELEKEVIRIKKQLEKFTGLLEKKIAYPAKEMEQKDLMTKELFNKLKKLSTKKQIITELDKIVK